MSHTWAVCGIPAGNTAQGLCDMIGNVEEWVQDWYHINYTGAPSDGKAWESPAGLSRVVRGGHWKSLFGRQASSRTRHDPSFDDDETGFRCARPAAR